MDIHVSMTPRKVARRPKLKAFLYFFFRATFLGLNGLNQFMISRCLSNARTSMLTLSIFDNNKVQLLPAKVEVNPFCGWFWFDSASSALLSLKDFLRILLLITFKGISEHHAISKSILWIRTTPWAHSKHGDGFGSAKVETPSWNTSHCLRSYFRFAF